MTTDKLICAIESGKKRRRHILVCEEYIMESTFLQTVHPSLVQRDYWARGILLPTHLAVSHRVSRLRWAMGRKKLLLGHWLYVVFRTRGCYTLDRKDGWQIVRRSGGGNLRHYCIQEPALFDGGSVVVWVGIHKGGKTSLVAPDGNVNAFMSWTFWKTSAFYTKDELMETTFGFKTSSFAHIWLLQWNNFLKHMVWCWYHVPLAP